jgi:GNAT superfamily N-acetyltransferase
MIRPATPHDVLPVARVHVRAWQKAYRGLVPGEFLDQMRPEDRAQRYTFGSADLQLPFTLLAHEGGVIQGFATTAPANDAGLAGYGELNALYVDPDYWGRGIGLALMQAARARLSDLGFGHALLWMLAGNTRAERFYQLDGWTHDGARKPKLVWGVTVESLRFQRKLERL